MVSRTLIISQSCPEGTELCADGSCQVTGFCDGGAAQQEDNTAPGISLPEGTSETVLVVSGQPYKACGEEDTGLLCEQGVLAVDEEDGNLDDRVLSCPPASCLPFGCPGHEFAVKGELLLHVCVADGPALNSELVVVLFRHSGLWDHPRSVTARHKLHTLIRCVRSAHPSGVGRIQQDNHSD